MLPLFIVVVGSLTVILQFDGSLRPPRDPITGFTYSSSVFPTRQLVGSEKMASCGATISLYSPSYDGHDERLIAIGGRYILPNVPGITSADTEYDGLLLGLDWLVHAFSSDEEYCPTISMLNKWSNTMGLSNDVSQVPDPTTLIIRGDCKTVIDQLESRSVPRKLETKYNLAIDRIESLKELYIRHCQKLKCENLGTDEVSVSNELSMCFEHVPRGHNHLCDAICKLVIKQKQAEIVKSIKDLIQLGEEDATKSADECNSHTPSHSKGKRTKQSKKKHPIQPKSVYFQQAFDNICHTPQLCHSSRLALACELTKVSIRQKDAASLNNFSGFFLQMSRRWSRIYYEEGGVDAIGRDTLRKVSINCEKLSNHISDVSFDNQELCCDGVASIFELCTNSSSLNGFDSTAIDMILEPYSDISEIISCVELESQRHDLQTWNSIDLKRQKNEDLSINSDLGIWIELS